MSVARRAVRVSMSELPFGASHVALPTRRPFSFFHATRHARR